MSAASTLVLNDQPLSSTYEIPENVAENIRHALRGLQFGEITIMVRNGSVVQIERVARKRQFKSNQND
ncbi:DUF2292 domain-containing protein [Schlesneria sp. DSM 10557]|uniref:DUF2292 domain-containing protein n=1 Tax=Schlesneria sp. DSM 10557 TaxID=3044399 RepID=UPI0035A16DC9